MSFMKGSDMTKMTKRRPVMMYHSLFGGIYEIKVLCEDKLYQFFIPDSDVIRKIVYGKYFGWNQFRKLQELQKLRREEAQE